MHSPKSGLALLGLSARGAGGSSSGRARELALRLCLVHLLTHWLTHLLVHLLAHGLLLLLLCLLLLIGNASCAECTVLLGTSLGLRASLAEVGEAHFRKG